MSHLLIQGGILTDPANQREEAADLRIHDGVIAERGARLAAQPGEQVLDARGLHVLPGLIDLHSHLRDPGLEYKEDIITGTRSAARGGFTTVLCMANTKPVNDNATVTRYIIEKAQKEGCGVRVYPIGAVSRGLKGEVLAEIGEMKEAGVIALSDDGCPVMNSQLLRLAMSYANHFGLIIMSHSEDLPLVNGGVMNEGEVSTRIGLRGTTCAAEEVMIARDIQVAQTLDLPIHLCHVSTRGGVQLVREAKARGVKVTAETAPHYLAATDEWVADYNPMTRVNPPLRTQDDQDALIAGLLDGTLDCIATDHAPHHMDEKRVEYQLAASGISGFETAFAICYTQMVRKSGATLSQLARWMSANPARIVALPGGSLSVGAPGDVALVDTKAEWTVSAKDFVSKGKNTPFDGKTFTGKVCATCVAGQVVFQDTEKGEGL